VPSNGSLARGFEDLGSELGNIAHQMAKEDNETKAKEADARIAAKVRNITMGDASDPSSTGFLNTQGHATLGAFGEAEKAIRSSVEEEIAAASNPSLRSMIQARASRRLEVALDSMTGHAAEQRLVVQERASLAREEQALADVSADWGNKDALHDGLMDVEAEVLDRAEANGLGEDATASMLRERQSVVVKGAFDAALASSDVVRAQAIFSKHADKLDGPTRTTMAQALVADVLAVTSQSLAQESMAKFPDDPAAAREFIRESVKGKAQSTAIAEYDSMLEQQRGDTRFALAIRNARVSDERAKKADERAKKADERADRSEERALRSEKRAIEAERRAIESEAARITSREYTVNERKRKEAVRAASGAAYSYLYQQDDNGSYGTVEQFKAENPEQYRLLASEGKIEALVSVESKIATGNVFARVSDEETMRELSTLPTEERARVNLDLYRHLLTRGDYRSLLSSVASAKNRIEAAAHSSTLYNAGDGYLREFTKATLGKTKNEENINAFNAASAKLTMWIDDQIQSGSPPTMLEVRAEAARLTMKVHLDKPFWFDYEELAVKSKDLTPEQRATVTVPINKIPEEVMVSIAEFVYRDWPELDGKLEQDVDTIENLAGAFALNDTARMRSILNRLTGR